MFGRKKASPPSVEMRAQVKLAEKDLKKAQDKEAAIANRIRDALRSGNRPEAEKWAHSLNEARQELDFSKQKLAHLKNLHAQATAADAKMAKDIKRVKSLEPIIKAQNAMADAVNLLNGEAAIGGAQDMIRKIEEDAALTEAKMDIALDDAGLQSEISKHNEAAQKLGAEDLLRQIELDMNIEGNSGAF